MNSIRNKERLKVLGVCQGHDCIWTYSHHMEGKLQGTVVWPGAMSTVFKRIPIGGSAAVFKVRDVLHGAWVDVGR